MARPKRLFASLILVLSIVPRVHAGGPFGTIHIGSWAGGAYTSETTGAFSHCAAAEASGSGGTLTLTESTDRLWQVGFADPSLNMPKGATFPIDVTFDGQAPFHVMGAAATAILVTAALPEPAMRQFRKSHSMVLHGTNHSFQFPLSATDNLVAAIENCVTRMSASPGIAGDFSIVSKKTTAAANPVVPFGQASAAAETPAVRAGKPALVNVSGTGFLISKEGHIVTNNHVIKDCVSDVQGNFVGQPAKKLRIVATDGTNDLALLQANGAKKTFKEPATIRNTPVQSGDEVVAIGFPFHGLLTSDFTVTTGIVNSLSGILNDTRFLQISAPVQPGNSGGPLLDMSGHVVGVVSSKLNALKFAKATGDIPENINFALKTGTVRDFLDNSVVPYGTEQSQEDLKAADIASAARSYIMLITCTASVREAGGK
jgi:S1-C subfamily serine protease